MSGSLMTAAEVAELHGVPRSWVYEQSRRGQIPPGRSVGIADTEGRHRTSPNVMRNLAGEMRSCRGAFAER